MGKQHVQMYRKVRLREPLIAMADAGAAFIPFIGDGDLAELYFKTGKFHIFGADIDEARVKTARSRITGERHQIITADCDVWPFKDVKIRQRFSIADFDAYNNPYHSFRSFWQSAKKSKRLVMFFTDGIRQSVIRQGLWITPDGDTHKDLPINVRRRIRHFYWRKIILPWFVHFINPYKIVRVKYYLRGHMLYWGVAIKRA